MRDSGRTGGARALRVPLIAITACAFRAANLVSAGRAVRGTRVGVTDLSHRDAGETAA